MASVRGQGARLVRWGRSLFGIVEFPGAGRWAAASLIDAVGTGLLMPLAVLYFTIHVGLSPSSVVLGLTIGGLVALAFGPPGGVLIDALGPKPVRPSWPTSPAARPRPMSLTWSRKCSPARSCNGGGLARRSGRAGRG